MMLNSLPQINNQIITKPKFKAIAGTQLPLINTAIIAFIYA